MTNFKYEVAFSFLAADEPLAREINALVAERVSTFVYSERQEELIGADGIVQFATVFGQDARTVAVLWRPEWGTTKFTGVEERAIRDRVFRQGAEFVTLIALHTPVDPPLWFPRSRIWGEIRALGSAGVAGIVLERIRMNGTTIREETAVENAARLERELQACRDRERIRDSQAGVSAANTAYAALEAALRDLAPKVGIAIQERGHNQNAFTRDWFALIPVWTLAYSNTVAGAALRLKYFKRSSETRERVFDFHVLSETEMVWREQSSGRLFSNEQLANDAVITLLNYIREALLPNR